MKTQGETKQFGLGGIFTIMVCLIAVIAFAAPACAADDIDVYVAGADTNGNAYYSVSSVSDGEVSFSPLEVLQQTQASGIPGYHLTYGNGIGDFDNDGDYDYIAGFGYGSGHIYIFEFEKTVDGYTFAAPVEAGSWSGAYYPMDMAVADFNNDGNQDFVMSYYGSTTTGLYLGDGDFGFTYIALPDSAPGYSSGIDAADFDNDGWIDFVVVSRNAEPIHVNMNDGDGTYTPWDGTTPWIETFTTREFVTADGNVVFGVAAADFDNDRQADIATAGVDNLIVYIGQGDGTFQGTPGQNFELNQSAIDNYDFDGDGNQDLVAADFSTTSNTIAILMGQGDGSFIHNAGDILETGFTGALTAVSAPPYVPVTNTEPVAVLDPLYYEVTVGEAVEFDGSLSYDEDGEIVEYGWDFGDENPAAGISIQQTALSAGNDKRTHVFQEVGQYLVTLTVTDDKGATASIQAEVQVTAVPAVPVKVRFKPRTINLKSRGRWIWATVKVPAGYDGRQIDCNSLKIVSEDGSVINAYPRSEYGFFRKFLEKYGSKRRINIKFSRQVVAAALAGTSGETALALEGTILHDGKEKDIAGSGNVMVIEKEKKPIKYKRLWKFWTMLLRR